MIHWQVGRELYGRLQLCDVAQLWDEYEVKVFEEMVETCNGIDLN